MKFRPWFALGVVVLMLAWALPLSADDSAAVVLLVADDHVDFLVGKDLIGRYHFSPEASSVAKPYFWPLNGPNGVPITRAWPMEKTRAADGSDDHPHQKSVWFCHGDVIPEGIALKDHVKGVQGVDFWS